MKTIKIAIQKKGRLSERSLDLLKECGIKLSNGSRKLKTSARNFPMEILFLRDDDIPHYVEKGVADIGILGENEVWEKGRDVEVIEKLGFGNCRMSLAIARDMVYDGLADFEGKRIATSYPNILRNYFADKGMHVEVEELGGSVEIATGIGLADAVFDIVSTGSTLLMNGLKEVEVLMRSEAVLIANKQMDAATRALLDALLFRIQSYKNGQGKKYLLMNVPNEIIPSILPLADEGWSSVHSVVGDEDFWEIIDELKRLGAEGILVVPIEKMIV